MPMLINLATESSAPAQSPDYVNAECGIASYIQQHARGFSAMLFDVDASCVVTLIICPTRELADEKARAMCGEVSK